MKMRLVFLFYKEEKNFENSSDGWDADRYRNGRRYVEGK